MTAARPASALPKAWWQSRLYLSALLIVSLSPYAFLSFPPLTDLPGHLARFAIAADGGANTTFARYFDHHWRPVGNMGVDVLVAVLEPLFGVKLATKLVVLSIPPVFIAGMWYLSHTVSGSVPPTMALVAVLPFSNPYVFGFVNFMLGLALLPFILAVWISLGRTRRSTMRAAIMLVAATMLYLTHAFAWGLLGLAAFGAELHIRTCRGEGWRPALPASIVAMWPLCLPVAHLAYLAAQSDGAGAIANGWFGWQWKLLQIVHLFRDHDPTLDLVPLASMLLVAAVTVWPKSPLWTQRGPLLVAGLVLLVAFVLIPRMLFNSAYADIRVLPAMAALLLLAVRPSSREAGWVVAILATAVLLLRVGTIAWSGRLAATQIEERLAVTAKVESGSRVLILQSKPRSSNRWSLHRGSMIGGLLIADRGVFANSLWSLGETGLLEHRADAPDGFDTDPSHLVRLDDSGPPRYRTYEEALADFPRDEFDYLWLIDVPVDVAARDPALVQEARADHAALFRIAR